MFLLLVFLILLCFYYWLMKDDKTLPPSYLKGLPLIGHYHLLLGSPDDVWQFSKNAIKFTTENGGVSRIALGTYNLYWITDPDDCLTVLNTCLDKGYMYKFGKSWLGEGVMLSDVLEWKVLRKMCNPFFAQRILNQYVVVFNELGRKFVKTFQKQAGKGKFDPENDLIFHTMDVTCRVVVGLNSEHHYETFQAYTKCLAKLFKFLAQRFCKPWLHNDTIYQLTSSKRKYDKVVETGALLIREMINNRKAEVMKLSSNDRPDEFKPILDVLLESSETDDSMTDVKLRQLTENIIVAGFDTSATALTYLLVLIGTYKDVQDKIFKELQDIFGDSDKDVDKVDLPKLVYLEAVIKETLRFYSLAPIVARTASVSLKLKNYTIPPGGTYLIAIHGVSRHSMWGADAEEFRPERWLEPGGVPDNPNAFAAFSLGKRNCIGKHYAMMFLKTTLVHLLRHYKVTADATKMVLKYDGFLRPASGHDIEIKLRK